MATWPVRCITSTGTAQRRQGNSGTEKRHSIMLSRVTPIAVTSVTTARQGRNRRGWAHGLVQFDPGKPTRKVRASAVARLLRPSGPALGHAICSLVAALDARDTDTRQHSRRVARYALAIARTLGLKRDRQKAVCLGAELHDIGKIGVPDRLLQRAGPLNRSEHRAVLEHTVIGERILRPLLASQPTVLAIVRSHHEWVDGSGFPDGLRADQLPLEARIVAVADSLDAMISARPYRPPLPLTEVVRELLRGTGTQFDADCVRALLTLLFRGTQFSARPFLTLSERYAPQSPRGPYGRTSCSRGPASTARDPPVGSAPECFSRAPPAQLPPGLPSLPSARSAPAVPAC